MLTRETVLRHIRYEADTGCFYRLATNERSGTQDSRGYRKISIDGRQYLEHRLAWLIVHGAWPSMLDHINGNPSDNRITNLRVATYSENMANKTPYPSNKTGMRGVFKHPNGTYRVQFTKLGKTHSFGYFASLEQAKEVAEQAAEELHGEFAGYRRSTSRVIAWRSL